MLAFDANDVRGKPDGAEALVVAERRFHERVAEHRRVDPGAHLFDFVLAVDHADIMIFAAKREGHFQPFARRPRRRVVGEGRPQKAMRRRPDFRRAFFDGGELRRRDGRRPRRRALLISNIPCRRAVHIGVDLLLDRSRALTPLLHELLAHDPHARGGDGVVDIGNIAADVETRPGQRGVGRLTELEPLSRAGKFDGFDVGRAERARGFLQRGRLRGRHCHGRGQCQA